VFDGKEELVDGMEEVFFNQEPPIKNNTTNMVDLIKSINQKNEDKLGTTQVLTKKDASFFSQNNLMDVNKNFEDDEQELEEDYKPYDERDQLNVKHHKNKVPFSFLMHHHFKMNKGGPPEEGGFYKPKTDAKINNFIEGMGKNHKHGINPKKDGANNLSSNI